LPQYYTCPPERGGGVDTRPEAMLDSRCRCAPVAQWIERFRPKEGVRGSNPFGGAIPFSCGEVA
jgi:hypothetical protein